MEPHDSVQSTGRCYYGFMTCVVVKATRPGGVRVRGFGGVAPLSARWVSDGRLRTRQVVFQSGMLTEEPRALKAFSFLYSSFLSSFMISGMEY